MKNLFIILFLHIVLFYAVTLQAQSYYTTLNVNNINALIKPIGSQFNDWTNSAPMYYVADGEGASTIYTSTLWIGGVDNNENLHFSGERFRQLGRDYIVGPLSYNNGLFVADGVQTMWDTIWVVERSEIEEFLANNNNPLYEIPQSILNWPAHGNTAIGQSHNLAPYFDVNNDGNYNPEDGDYPNIRGDKCLFFIFNDLCEHTESKGTPMGIEVHGMAYAFDIEEDEAFSNSVFFNYMIINRSDTTYNDTYVGIFADFDIGHAYDDYIGCDVDRGSFYAYNGDDFDETANGVIGFGENPPAQSATLLGGPYKDSDGVDNPKLDNEGNQIVDESINGLNFGDGIIDNERFGMTGFYYFYNSGSGAHPATTDPYLAIDYYNYMKGYWRDSTPLLYGGTGHYSGDATSDENAKFMFPGNPSSDTYNWGTNGVDLGAWSEETEDNPVGDKRGVCSTGSFTFEPGDTAVIDIVYVYGVEINAKGNSVNAMKQNIDVVRNSFINNITPDGNPIIYSYNQESKITNNDEVKIFPNPAKDMISLKINSLNNGVIDIYNVNGQKVMSQNFNGNENIIKISLSDLCSGLYFVKVKSDTYSVIEKISVVR